MTNPIAKRLKSTYRKERVSSFIFIMGTVDIVIGTGTNGSLLAIGLLFAMTGMGWRWWHNQKPPAIEQRTSSPRYLQPASDRGKPLPLIINDRYRSK
jgi:hypothetical protein